MDIKIVKNQATQRTYNFRTMWDAFFELYKTYFEVVRSKQRDTNAVRTIPSSEGSYGDLESDIRDTAEGAQRHLLLIGKPHERYISRLLLEF